LFCTQCRTGTKHAGELPAGKSPVADSPLKREQVRHSLFWSWVASSFSLAKPRQPSEPHPPSCTQLLGGRSRNWRRGRGPSACGSASRCSFHSVMPAASRQEATPVACAARPHNESTRSPPWCIACLGRGQGFKASRWRRDRSAMSSSPPCPSPRLLQWRIAPWPGTKAICMANTRPLGLSLVPNIPAGPADGGGVERMVPSARQSAQQRPPAAADACHRPQALFSQSAPTPSPPTSAAARGRFLWRWLPSSRIGTCFGSKIRRASLTPPRARREHLARQCCLSGSATPKCEPPGLLTALRPPAATGDDPVFPIPGS